MFRKTRPMAISFQFTKRYTKRTRKLPVLAMKVDMRMVNKRVRGGTSGSPAVIQGGWSLPV